MLAKRSLEVNLAIWTHEKQGWEEADKKVRKERQKTEDAGAQEGGKVAKTWRLSHDSWLRRVKK